MSAVADPLDIPTYTPTIAARLARLSKGRVRRWLRGHEYSYMPAGSEVVERRISAPLVKREGTSDSHYASFLDLVDLLFVKNFLKYGVTLKRLRLALEEARRLLGSNHFAHERFWTDGRNVYLELGDKAEHLRQLGSGGQWAIPDVIKTAARQFQFNQNSGFAERWSQALPGHLK